MEFLSNDSAVSVRGREISTPGRLTKVVDTIKKINRMKTTPIKGETLIDSLTSSSEFLILLLMWFASESKLVAGRGFPIG